MLEVRQCRQCLSFFFSFIFLICWQDGIKPMWEDDRNRRGGRWLITLSKQQRKSDLDRFWLETVRSVPSLRASDSEQNVLGQSHLVAVLITKHLETRWHSRRNTDAINRTWTWASYDFTQRCSVSTAAIVAVLLLRLAVLLKKKNAHLLLSSLNKCEHVFDWLAVLPPAASVSGGRSVWWLQRWRVWSRH